MAFLGYIASLLIGLSLGLIGGGGSILTVPVMVYLFHIPALMATSYSLFIVGTTSLLGAIRNLKDRQVSVRTALLFGSSSIVTVYLTRKVVIPRVPREFFIGGTAISENLLVMIVFGLLMLVASVSMIKSRTFPDSQAASKVHIAKLLLIGVCIGLVTGFLGAGGGFLIIPTLVLIMKLPMKRAVGTSLLIIAMNSLIGFIGDLGHFKMDWQLLISVTLMAICGLVIGNRIARQLPSAQLKKGFGWFVLVMGIYILLRELL